jgi:glyoxylase-like metal-dependent hydrolase (beta-lactamase superfamily II)
MILEAVRVGELEVNCYILACGHGQGSLIIDPGADEKKIRAILDRYSLKAGLVVNTHGHIDHIGCDDAFGVPVVAHALDLPLLRDPALNLSGFLSFPYSVKSPVKELADGQLIEFSGLVLEVMHTPGHTPGGICLLLRKPEGGILFTGDTLFFHSVGRTDFPGADQETLIRSIREKLLGLPDETLVYPGHGASSTIGREKQANPFLN